MKSFNEPATRPQTQKTYKKIKITHYIDQQQDHKQKQI